jgi:hypothetical protein
MVRYCLRVLKSSCENCQSIFYSIIFETIREKTLKNLKYLIVKINKKDKTF